MASANIAGTFSSHSLRIGAATVAARNGAHRLSALHQDSVIVICGTLHKDGIKDLSWSPAMPLSAVKYFMVLGAMSGYLPLQVCFVTFSIVIRLTALGIMLYNRWAEER